MRRLAFREGRTRRQAHPFTLGTPETVPGTLSNEAISVPSNQDGVPGTDFDVAKCVDGVPGTGLDVAMCVD